MASRAPLWFTASVDSLATEEEPVVKTLATVELTPPCLTVSSTSWQRYLV